MWGPGPESRRVGGVGPVGFEVSCCFVPAAAAAEAVAGYSLPGFSFLACAFDGNFSSIFGPQAVAGSVLSFQLRVLGV